MLYTPLDFFRYRYFAFEFGRTHANRKKCEVKIEKVFIWKEAPRQAVLLNCYSSFEIINPIMIYGVVKPGKWNGHFTSNRLDFMGRRDGFQNLDLAVTMDISNILYGKQLIRTECQLGGKELRGIC